MAPSTATTLGYTEYGPEDAPLLCVTHGWATDSSFTFPLVSLLPKLRLRLIDLPGYGLSLKHAAAADDFEQGSTLLANTLPEGSIVLSWSLSTLWVLAACAMKERKLRGLITVCGSPRFPSDPNWSGLDYNYILKLRNFFTEQKATHLLQIFFRLQGSGKVNTPQVNAFVRSQAAKCVLPPYEVLRAGLDDMIYRDLRAQFHHLNLPSLHLFGAYDRLVPPQNAARMATKARSKALVFANSAHMPYLTEPEEFAQVVGKFCDIYHSL
ncbi:MAG: alpha/beta fold hydrolase [Succinivibrio sp.]|nr:alpha/beta fold hydrolase [Succinivibrio sp.]